MADSSNPRRPTPGARRVTPAPSEAPTAPPAAPPVAAAPPPVVAPSFAPPVEPPAAPPAALPAAMPAAPPAASGEGYDSSVVAPAQIVLGVASGAIIAVILTALNSGLWPIGLLIFLIAAGVGVYLAPVSLGVDGKRVTISQGRKERDPLVVYVAEIRDAGLREVTWPQCFGFGGIESDDRTTRLAVRAGTTLVLTLFDGARILVSVSDGPAALRAIEAAAAAA